MRSLQSGWTAFRMVDPVNRTLPSDARYRGKARCRRLVPETGLLRQAPAHRACGDLWTTGTATRIVKESDAAVTPGVATATGASAMGNARAAADVHRRGHSSECRQRERA